MNKLSKDQSTEKPVSVVPSVDRLYAMEKRQAETASVLIQNLQLLGFDEKKAKQEYGVECSDAMFTNSNIRGLEIVLHFMMLSLFGEDARKVGMDTAHLFLFVLAIPILKI